MAVHPAPEAAETPLTAPFFFHTPAAAHTNQHSNISAAFIKKMKEIVPQNANFSVLLHFKINKNDDAIGTNMPTAIFNSRSSTKQNTGNF